MAPSRPSDGGLAGAMRRPRAVIVAICVVVVAGALGAVAIATTSGSGKVNTGDELAYLDRVGGLAQVHAQGGRGGDRRLSLQLGQPAHHEELVRHLEPVPARAVPRSTTPCSPWCPRPRRPQAIAANAATGGKGWTCFGAPSLPNASLAAFLSTPFLSVWAPGHGADVLPKGTGIALAKGSLVIEQVHYNLLVGDKPVTNSLVLNTVPASTPLLPMQSQYLVAPPNIPCPAGVTGPLLQLPGVAQLPEPALRLRRPGDGQGHRRHMW